LSLTEAVTRAAGVLPAAPERLVERVLGFLRERLRQMLLDAGSRHDLTDAALATGFDDPRDLDRRLAAVVELAGRPDWPELVTVVERTHNIAKKETGDLGEPAADRLEEPEERALFEALTTHGAEIAAAFEAGDHVAASTRYREVFAAPVHAFFDKVFVNVEDAELRRNRMALCRAVNRLLTSRLADLARVVMEGA
jgi:glycyl-tRNA synthetase beta chain